MTTTMAEQFYVFYHDPAGKAISIMAKLDTAVNIIRNSGKHSYHQPTQHGSNAYRNSDKDTHAQPTEVEFYAMNITTFRSAGAVYPKGTSHRLLQFTKTGTEDGVKYLEITTITKKQPNLAVYFHDGADAASWTDSRMLREMNIPVLDVVDAADLLNVRGVVSTSSEVPASASTIVQLAHLLSMEDEILAQTLAAVMQPCVTATAHAKLMMEKPHAVIGGEDIIRASAPKTPSSLEKPAAAKLREKPGCHTLVQFSYKGSYPQLQEPCLSMPLAAEEEDVEKAKVDRDAAVIAALEEMGLTTPQGNEELEIEVPRAIVIVGCIVLASAVLVYGWVLILLFV